MITVSYCSVRLAFDELSGFWLLSRRTSAAPFELKISILTIGCISISNGSTPTSSGLVPGFASMLLRFSLIFLLCLLI